MSINLTNVVYVSSPLVENSWAKRIQIWVCTTMNELDDIINVRILRHEPNTINKSNQHVSIASVSKDVAFLFEDFKKGRKTLEQARQELDRLSAPSVIKVPFSVYVNVHNNHASVVFLQADLLNRTNTDVEESRKLAKMNMGLRVFFSPNSFQVINPIKVRRIDLATTDGQEYKIGMTSDLLKNGVYKMFKCYEVIGISDYDVEWAYLMAARDWYDTAANNCLSYSKRIIREIHRQVMDADLDASEMSKLNKLYISMPGESIFEISPYPISSFLAPQWQVPMVAVAFLVIVIIYVEIRLRSFFQQWAHLCFMKLKVVEEEGSVLIAYVRRGGQY